MADLNDDDFLKALEASRQEAEDEARAKPELQRILGISRREAKESEDFRQALEVSRREAEEVEKQTELQESLESLRKEIKKVKELQQNLTRLRQIPKVTKKDNELQQALTLSHHSVKEDKELQQALTLSRNSAKRDTELQQALTLSRHSVKEDKELQQALTLSRQMALSHQESKEVDFRLIGQVIWAMKKDDDERMALAKSVSLKEHDKRSSMGLQNASVLAMKKEIDYLPVKSEDFEGMSSVGFAGDTYVLKQIDHGERAEDQGMLCFYLALTKGRGRDAIRLKHSLAELADALALATKGNKTNYGGKFAPAEECVLYAFVITTGRPLLVVRNDDESFILSRDGRVRDLPKDAVFLKDEHFQELSLMA